MTERRDGRAAESTARAAQPGKMAADSTGVVTVLMTAPDAPTAEGIVRRLLDEGLVACANVLPGATSIYRWEGKVQRDEEVVVMMKSTHVAAERVVERAEELHPYDVPELLVHEVTAGAPAYLEWVRSECRPAPAPVAERSR